MPKGWKNVQSKAKRSKRTKLALGVLGLLVGFLILSWTIRFTQSLFSPWKTPAQERSYFWNGEFSLNLLVRGRRGISILSYNPKQARIVIINIPDETLLEVPHGFGLWQLRAVYGLGGDSLLKDTLTNFLAIPIDGFLDLSSLQPPKSAAEVVNLLKENPFSGANLLSYLKTDLTVMELLRFKLAIAGIRFDKVKQLNLDQLNVLDRENLPDGTPVFTADPVKLDSVLSDLADPALTSEHKSIAVFNATGKPQLALKWARLITNLGGDVIITANAEKNLEKTKVQGVQSATLRRLKQIFTSGEKKVSEDNVISSRAEINLLLGEDRQ